ncbi:MaoC/PaaZ C-terminal domain-containing protein [Aurantiacibacter zhengii]|uniref:3-alpha,7-alpha, 12-alpha-trihydroxy-5-beta-cholest-24-enoyl-CoA hydratase n=1 Tax=Aurantiacibacter zhengii TaxID=2307003 RepID=A0A418NT40_9SPHN|nr:MaoC/PaaZ C-terminal domain-containing protein [Aurantiacibacter zhengii]RIV86810.1 3-alpha,7-alpha,12-alpha-trihydroxy-5-beta-cholest-24-enoyl-CoA hydratase [Aurantiacibacter zhengii]
MPLTAKALTGDLPGRRFSYDLSATRLYALGVALAADGSERDLAYLLGDQPEVLPSQATVIAWDDRWIDELGLDVTRIVHGEQRITLHRPIPPRASGRSEVRIIEALDKGPDKGAILYVETTLFEDGHDLPLATLISTVFARGDGGFGGPSKGGLSLPALPETEPDCVARVMVPLNQAHIYRLSGDENPLHVDPEFAARAGFDRPILHGLCTYGMALRQVIGEACGDEPGRVASIAARFTAPVFMGDTLETSIWKLAEDQIAFRTAIAERGDVVLDYGRLELR